MSRSVPLACAAVLAGGVLLARPERGCGAETGPAERRIEEALFQKTQLDFVVTPLQDVVDTLMDLHQIQIVIDQRALDDMGLASDTPITINLKDISLESALELMLRNLELTWTVRHEVLLITTPEEEECELITKVYPVADLVAGNDPAQSRDDLQSLINVITSTVQVESWEDIGGPGSIATLDSIRALVIAQTYKIHRRIAVLLNELRAVAREQAGSKRQAAGSKTPAADAKKPKGGCKKSRREDPFAGGGFGG